MRKLRDRKSHPPARPLAPARAGATWRAFAVLAVGMFAAGVVAFAMGSFVIGNLSISTTTSPSVLAPVNAPDAPSPPGTWHQHASPPALNLVPSLDNATCETDRELMLTDPPMRGEDVWELKIRLVQLGFFEGPTDNVYDLATERAVREFQKAEGLTPDGVVTQAVWEALGRGVETEAEPADRTKRPTGELFIVIDLDRRTLTLYSDGKPYKTYPVAVGKWETPSPVGEWRVVHKATNWGGGFGPRWLGLDVPWGIYGIHGTNKPWSIGQAASGGCLRMPNEYVIELWDWVPEDTRVFIVGEVPRPEFILPQRFGSIGQDVVYTQLALRERGFDPGPADGRFGPQTERAVKDLQVFYGLPDTGVVTQDIYYLLGLR